MRVSSAIPEPTRGWGGVNGSSVGEVKKVTGSEGQEEITVDFPECKDWVGIATDLQFYREPVVGDSVQVIIFTAEVLITLTHALMITFTNSLEILLK